MTKMIDATIQGLEGFSKDRTELLKLLLEQKSRRTQRITPYPRAAGADLVQMHMSWAQQRLWFIDQLEGHSAAYRLGVAVRLHGSLDTTALRRALDTLVQRHESLRTVFVTADGQPKQQISTDGSFMLSEIDLSDDPARIEARLRLQKAEYARQQFDLNTGPLIHGRLIRLSAEEHVLLITMHHIVSDGWSMSVFVDELAQLYSALREGRDAQLPPLTIQYSDYAQWQRQWLQGDLLDKQIDYWRRNLEGAVPQLELPTDRPRPPVQSHRGDTVEVVINATLSSRLRALAQRHEMTLFMVLYAGWAVLLSRLSGQQDVLIGTPVANRQRPELEGLIGFFVNTLVLRSEVSGEARLDEFLKRVKQTTLAAYDHQDVPFEQVVEALQPERSLSRNPLFQVMFALQNAPRGKLQLSGLTVTPEHDAHGSSVFDLRLLLEERGDRIAGNVSYATDLFEHATIERWVACFTTLLNAMVEHEQACLGDLSILPEAQRRQVVEKFNATQSTQVHERLIHKLVEEQVERAPEAIAVTCGREQLTYAQLNRRANHLAHVLLEGGVKPDDRVALYVERSVEMIVGLLAILKAGAAYVPLDVSYPPERLTHMLRDSAPIALLTLERLGTAAPATNVRVIAIDAVTAEPTAEQELNPDPALLELRPSHLAYVIYTSGSTGTPKGAMVEHRSLVNLVQWHSDAFKLSAQTRCSSVASLGFDAATWEIWPPLSSGATLALAPAAVSGDVEALLAWWQAEPLDFSFLPTPIAELVLARNIRHPRLRALLTGGDRLRSRPTADGFALINNYGPTEATVLATSGRICAESDVVDIGRPIANTRIYVLDSQRQPVPIGVAGEIYIAGAAVARGYLNRPELTAERFVREPFNTDPRARMYKTGDLGRWRTDGTIEYVGRNDDQVKIRGFRIELGEIEAQLLRHESIADAAVIAREDVPCEKRLVAYVTAREGSHPGVDELRAHLKAVLPEHMVPSAFVVLKSLPLTTNGKLDRRALPVPDLDAYASREYEKPQGSVEETLAGIWQELLSVERVGRHDNFFELGGHSLLIVQMLDRLRQAGLFANVRGVFDSRTLADLAGVVTQVAARQSEVPPNLIPDQCKVLTAEMLPLVDLQAHHIERIVQAVPGGAANIQDIYPLVPLQEGILFHHLMNEYGGDAYVLPIVLTMSSRERVDALAAALQAAIDRHDILRTAVMWDQLPQPVQVVYRRAILQMEEAAFDAGTDPSEQIKEWIRPERQRLDLRLAPLMRLRVAQDTNTGQWYVLWQLHHIVDDATSRKILVAELVAHLENRARFLAPPVPYRNHVAQAFAHARTNDSETFFRDKLGDVDEPTAPFGMLDVYGDGSQIAEHQEELEAALAQRVRSHAGRLGVTVATLFHAAWSLVVARTTGREDVVFGSVLLGRLQGDTDKRQMLGLFINTLPLRLRLQGLTAKELVKRAQHELVELLGHEQTSLAVAQRCSGIVGTAPLFSSLLNFRHGLANARSNWAGLEGMRIVAGRNATNYPITLSVDDLGEGFKLTAQTDRRVQPRRMTGYLQTALCSLIDALEQAPQTSALQLSILTATEQRLMLEQFNATRAPYPQEPLVHELYEAQVDRTPDAVAVVHDAQSLTYGALNASANRLARYLIQRGVGPGQVVGLCVERSLEMIVGLLGILKSGAAYLPLDPNYPAERLRHTLEDAAPKLLLTQSTLRASLPATSVAVLELDASSGEIDAHDATNLAAAELGLAAQDLVYVIYTSGSTGRPKGTEMRHRSMVNLIEWHRSELCAERQRVLQFAALSFDVAFQEIFSTLCTGGTLLLLDEWVRRDARALAELLRSQAVERLFVPPLMLQGLAEHVATSGDVPEKLRDVVTAGEQLRISPEITRLFSQLNGCRLHNHYGPTETHVVTALTLDAGTRPWPALPSIGRPIPNSQIYILDSRRQPVPLGVSGEIYIGGAGVARGYLNRTELTEERFVGDPFSADSHARLYRTGDVGRWLEDGTIEYLGRNDDQVKIRGYRIEVGEIEAQLLRREQVKEAVVVARQEGSDKRLVAYVTQHEHGALSVEDLRAGLKANLPEHMVPSAFVILKSLPRTATGKLNRRALPAPELAAYATRQYEAPQGELEELLARIWGELLHVAQVGRQDNFFELGGHSLLATRVMSRIRELCAVEIPLRALFDAPILQDLSARIELERQGQLELETLRMDDLARVFREQIGEMDDDAVLARIASLELEQRMSELQ